MFPTEMIEHRLDENEQKALGLTRLYKVLKSRFANESSDEFGMEFPKLALEIKAHTISEQEITTLVIDLEKNRTLSKKDVEEKLKPFIARNPKYIEQRRLAAEQRAEEYRQERLAEEQRRLAAEQRRLAAEQRAVATEERIKVLEAKLKALEEGKLASQNINGKDDTNPGAISSQSSSSFSSSSSHQTDIENESKESSASKTLFSDFGRKRKANGKDDEWEDKESKIHITRKDSPTK